MGYLGNQWAIAKVVLKDEERFIIRFDDNTTTPGYIFSTTQPLTEAQLREQLAKAGGTEFDIERVLLQARENYQKELVRTP
ncbi:MAG: DUF3656 domain-containing protein [Vicinamibacterales bacterium]|jgi:hypothetical protein